LKHTHIYVTKFKYEIGKRNASRIYGRAACRSTGEMKMFAIVYRSMEQVRDGDEISSPRRYSNFSPSLRTKNRARFFERSLFVWQRKLGALSKSERVKNEMNCVFIARFDSFRSYQCFLGVNLKEKIYLRSLNF